MEEFVQVTLFNKVTIREIRKTFERCNQVKESHTFLKPWHEATLIKEGKEAMFKPMRTMDYVDCHSLSLSLIPSLLPFLLQLYK